MKGNAPLPPSVREVSPQATEGEKLADFGDFSEITSLSPPVSFADSPLTEGAMPRGVIAVIGSGGKTTLIRRLVQRLPGTVIVCTSTHIYPFPELPLYTEPVEKLTKEKICMGTPGADGKLTAPIQSFEVLEKLADYVLVEADGAHGRPLKAHAPHEPVIPTCAKLVIQVVGLSGLGKPIAEAAHRPEIYAQLCRCPVDKKITPAMAAEVINVEKLADVVVLTQGECAELAERLYCPSIQWSLQENP